MQRNTTDGAMNSAITVRLNKSLQKRLEPISKKTGVSRSEIIRDALKRQLAILAVEKHRETAMPFAEARGYLTDVDVFREVS